MDSGTLFGTSEQKKQIMVYALDQSGKAKQQGGVCIRFLWSRLSPGRTSGYSRGLPPPSFGRRMMKGSGATQPTISDIIQKLFSKLSVLA